MRKLKNTITLEEDLCRLEITEHGKKKNLTWENLDDQEKRKTINALGNFFERFYECYKETNGNE